MNKKLQVKILESLSSVLPITVIVLLLCTTVAPLPIEMLTLFIFGAFLLTVGMGFFTLGADMAMMPIGESLGRYLTKSGKISVIIVACFLIGFIVTLAEPDLQILAGQTPGIPDATLIIAVASGVGIFLVAAFLRILFRWNLSWILIGCYAAVFTLAAFIPKKFLAVAFDSGGVTTGPITVPFIMALGLGLTSIVKDKSSDADSFGLIALSSVGPILSVLILGLLFPGTKGSYTPLGIPELKSSRELFFEFGKAFPAYAKEVFTALLPIFIFFLIFQIFFIRLRKNQVIKILVGMLYTFIGLLLFLTGVNVGFMPAGNCLGKQLASLPYNVIIIPIGMIIGYFIVKAEPAVALLNKQVEEISGGSISRRMMMFGLSIGMAISLGLSMVRVLTGISIFWFLIPGYLIAILLTFAVPRIFTSVAFDSGGVASGPMTATFLLPFAMGACDAVGGNVLTDAFGIVAMVAMTPLITIQIIGLVYKVKTSQKLFSASSDTTQSEDDVVEFNTEENENE